MKTLIALGIGAALGAGAVLTVNVYFPHQAVPVEEVRPVSWWRANEPQRVAMVAECRDNPGQPTANCRNALEADTAAALYGDGSPQPSILEGLSTWRK